MPSALPTTESSASRRPTVSARPIVKSRLGPGTWMKRALASTKASHWLVVGTRSLWRPSPPRARGLPVGKDVPMGAGHSHGSHRASSGGGAGDLEVPRGPRLTLLVALAVAGIAALIGLLLLWPDSAEVDRIAEDAAFAAPGVTFPTATLDDVHAACKAAEVGSDSACGRIEITVDDGAGKGDQATI